jgi:RNA polymerase sigma-70 factor (ECF subfamily)
VSTQAKEIEDWYRQYGPMVLRRCRWILKDEQQALDVLHDTFVQLLKEKGRLKAIVPSALLLQIATRLSLNRLRSRRRKPEDANEALLLTISIAAGQEDRSLAAGALRRLLGDEETTGTMAVMHLLDGMTLEEVAAETGYSVSGVRRRLRLLDVKIQQLKQEAA